MFFVCVCVCGLALAFPFGVLAVFSLLGFAVGFGLFIGAFGPRVSAKRMASTTYTQETRVGGCLE